ncbi:uncharacterized protein LOC132639490 [Lycium barbarum]|uniref:uncharacterized protein LOC132639490 n=1 Tax=Lycium barbarum TaxID=112863 RepID=UPI00293E84DC|nr:uncharacterized protein LOC132639490 [Lycium barbarum]
MASLTWDWRNKFIDYLAEGKLPVDPKESRSLRTKVARYNLIEGKLYRRSFYGPLARCLRPGETDYAMREAHKGTCGNHFKAESLVQRLIRAGYYWDHMDEDMKTFIQKCLRKGIGKRGYQLHMGSHHMSVRHPDRDHM